MTEVATKPTTHAPTTRPYEIEDSEMVAETSDLRVQLLTLAEGQSVPWHYHTRVNDVTFCLEGEIVIETRAPRATFRLKPGDRSDVPPKRAHTTKNVGAGLARFLILQGFGAFDFVPVG